MNYPTYLLPKSNYKKIQWTDDLLSLFLARHTPTKDLYMAGTCKVNTDNLQIQSNHLKDFSTNLLGDFIEENLKIEIQDKAKRDFYYAAWEEGEESRQPIFEEDFQINENRGRFFIKISEIISKRFVCIDTIDNQQYQLHFKVIHTPVKCNFWHFSIRVFDSNDIEISTLSVRDGLIKKFWKEAKERLVECVLINTVYFSKLDPIHYKK